MVKSISIRVDERMLEEIDRLALVAEVDRSTLIRQLLSKALPLKKLELAAYYYQNGETLERAAELTDVNLWDLIEYLRSRGITLHWDVDEWKTLCKKVLGIHLERKIM